MHRYGPRLAALVLAAAAVLVATPGTSIASGTVYYDYLESIQIDPATGAMSSSIPNWVANGDCSMFPDSTVVIAAPQGFFADTTITWHATTFTSHTDNGDIWHASFYLEDANRNYITVRGLDSPLMTQRYVDYTFDVSTPTRLPQADFDRARLIEWIGNC
jgi:hypothetical protein